MFRHGETRSAKTQTTFTGGALAQKSLLCYDALERWCSLGDIANLQGIPAGDKRKGAKMEAIVQEVDVEELVPVFTIPSEMRNIRVEVTIRPVVGEKPKTTAEKIEEFAKEHTREAFIEHLKQRVAAGFKFDFDVQKVIDGTETEEEMQARYRSEKSAWAEAVCKKFERSRCPENQ
jgi:hypothetical protein